MYPALRRFWERFAFTRSSPSVTIRRGRQNVWAEADAGLLGVDPIKSGGTLSAKIFRADGTTEDLGVIARLRHG